jgi:crossover junction endodeoxyribonuclease RusA
VCEEVSAQLPGVFIQDKILVEVVLFPPDARQRDVDNYNKALLDAITVSHLWEDDKLVDQLFNYRGESRSRNGSVYVRITEAGPVIRDVAMLPMN